MAGGAEDEVLRALLVFWIDDSLDGQLRPHE